MKTWTEDRDDMLKTLWNAEQTSGHIARVIGVSRNAVIGRAHRLGLRARPSPIKPKQVVAA